MLFRDCAKTLLLASSLTTCSSSSGGESESTVDAGAPGSSSVVLCTAENTVIDTTDYTIAAAPPYNRGTSVRIENNEIISFGDQGRQVLLAHKQAVTAPDGETGEIIFGTNDSTQVSLYPDDGDCVLDFPLTVRSSIGSLGSLWNFTQRMEVKASPASQRVMTREDAFDGSTVKTVGTPKMHACGPLGLDVVLEDDRKVFLRQVDEGPNYPMIKVIEEGQPIVSLPEFHFSKINDWYPDFWGNTFHADVSDGISTLGWMIFQIHEATGDFQCIATTAIDVGCQILVGPNDGELTAWSTNAAQTILILVKDGVQALWLRPEGTGEEIILTEVEIDKDTVANGFEFPLVCDANENAYFVAKFWRVGRGMFEEVYRMDRNAVLTRVTRFDELLDQESLSGTIPHDIESLSLGAACEMVIETRGKDNYRGLWAVWEEGKTVRAFDYADSLSIDGVTKAVTSLHYASNTNGHDGRTTAISSDGRFLFAANTADNVGAYVVVSRPEDTACTTLE